jgi:benzoyl-CoA-dihydrodiol lyase
MEPIAFETHPSRYRHWKLELPSDGSAIATLSLAVDEEHPLRPGYPLKLNSYDLGVDIELADAVQRLRFEHPEVKAIVVTSGKERVFCAGANIHMLASSSHPFKVNFCKFTNETRLNIEDASAGSGQRYLAACNGPTAGGGYELALACDEIVLLDDGSSTVSLPEVPLLGVLPGTGGLTRVVDKRRVRRDRADVFATLAEGIKGKRAVEWKLVDAVAPRSKFAQVVKERAQRLAALATSTKVEEPAGGGDAPPTPAVGVALDALAPEVTTDSVRYRYVELQLDRAHRTATITMRGPDADVAGLDAIVAAGARWWPLRAFRELDDALLRLRFNHEEIGLVLLKTRGDRPLLLRTDAELEARREHWFVREVLLHMARVLRRLDLTARSLFAVLDPESCFVGSLLELALAADRRYMLDDPKRPVAVQGSALNWGALPTTNGLSRLGMLGLEEEPSGIAKQPLGPSEADEAGLVTVLADELDFDDTLRLAIEERAAISPDALTGMEASFRCVGPETLQTKIFGRLSAWQNWIFTRPNATGEKGALSLYGKPERPSFDWRRT